MTEVVRPKFDVVRGWAGGTFGGSAYDRVFDKVVDGSAAPLKVKRGTFLTTDATGAILADCASGTAKGDHDVWLVVEGNDPADSYSGDYLDKVVAIKGSYEVLLSETMFAAGAYTVGAAVTITAGQVALQSGTLPTMGHVTAYDSASKLLTVAFSL